MSRIKKFKNIVKDASDSVSKSAAKANAGVKEKYHQVSGLMTGITLPFLSNPELLNWSENITKGTASIYDKALDMEYLKTHIGGGNHRMFDGGHDLFSAWDRVKDAKSDDSNTEEIINYVSSIWKDLTTKQGLPFFTWEKGNYDKYAEWCTEHIPFVEKSYFYDLLSFDVFELIGASIGAASLFFGLKNDDQKKVAEVIGSMGVTSIASANPIMAIALVFITAYVVFVMKKEIKSSHVAKGAIISTVSVAVFSILGFPLLIELGIAIIITILIRKKVLENDEFMSIVALQINYVKQSSKYKYDWVSDKLLSSFKAINSSSYMSQLNKITAQSFKLVTTGKYSQLQIESKIVDDKSIN
jgi:hypothetical protein